MNNTQHTLINYMVGYGITIPKDPYVKDFVESDWDEIYKYEAEWKKKNGYT